MDSFPEQTESTSIWSAPSHPRPLETDWIGVNVVKWLASVFYSMDHCACEGSIVGEQTECSESNVLYRYAWNEIFWRWWSCRSVTMTIIMANQMAMRIAVEGEGVMSDRGDFANSRRISHSLDWMHTHSPFQPWLLEKMLDLVRCIHSKRTIRECEYLRREWKTGR
jgi:hypothetical protein